MPKIYLRTPRITEGAHPVVKNENCEVHKVYKLLKLLYYTPEWKVAFFACCALAQGIPISCLHTRVFWLCSDRKIHGPLQAFV